MMQQLDLAFIGAGRMASAMVKGILARKLTTADRIRCTSAADGTAERLAQSTGIRIAPDPSSLIASCDWLVLACKPQQLDELDGAFARLCAGKSVLSILAGTRIAQLRKAFPEAASIVRVMPNTPAQIGMGVSAFALESELSPAGLKEVNMLLSALGTVLEVSEEQLDAVTALSGSGPAYVFEFVAALRDAGIATGLDAASAYTLALETVAGAAALLKAVPEPPEQHRDWVCSPGGTTMAGLAVMHKAGIREIMRDTVIAARDRSVELSQ
jgi:pyrroline-5-carboxylate reductase